MSLETTLLMVLYAALTTASVLLAAALVQRGRGTLGAAPGNMMPTSLAAPAVALGYFVAHWQLGGEVSILPPLSAGAKGAFPHIALLMALAATLAHLLRNRFAAFAVITTASMLASFLLLRAPIEFAWSQQESVWRLAMVAAGMTILVETFRSRTSEQSMTSLQLALLATFTAPALLFSDIASGAQLSGALASALGVVFLFSLRYKILIGPLAAAVGALLWSMWTMSFLLAEMPLSVFVLLVLALPASIVVARLAKGLSSRKRAFALEIAVLVVLSLAALGAGAARYFAPAPASQPASSGDYNADYGY